MSESGVISCAAAVYVRVGSESVSTSHAVFDSIEELKLWFIMIARPKPCLESHREVLYYTHSATQRHSRLREVAAIGNVADELVAWSTCTDVPLSVAFVGS